MFKQKKKVVKNQDVPMNSRRFWAVIATMVVMIWLGFKGVDRQSNPPTTAAGMTQGAIQVFADAPTVIPLSKGDVPVGVLKINGITYAIYTTTNNSGQPR